mmetsp:Transcript_2074/g.7477  ORF Transcript_2074/g.7477 Transcript_2074/m.7477 type:complete len:205 (-) Transcript_2074:305-919(-)
MYNSEFTCSDCLLLPVTAPVVLILLLNRKYQSKREKTQLQSEKRSSTKEDFEHSLRRELSDQISISEINVNERVIENVNESMKDLYQRETSRTMKKTEKVIEEKVSLHAEQIMWQIRIEMNRRDSDSSQSIMGMIDEEVKKHVEEFVKEQNQGEHVKKIKERKCSNLRSCVLCVCSCILCCLTCILCCCILAMLIAVFVVFSRR